MALNGQFKNRSSTGGPTFFKKLSAFITYCISIISASGAAPLQPSLPYHFYYLILINAE